MCRNAGSSNTNDACRDRLILLNHIAVGDAGCGEWSRSCNRNGNWNGNCDRDFADASAHCGIHFIYCVYDVYMEKRYGNVIGTSCTYTAADHHLPGNF